MSRSRSIPVLPIVLSAMLALGGYWLSKNVEMVEREVEKTESEEVRKNPLLAATLLVEQYGFAVENQDELAFLRQLPDAQSTVLWLYQLDVLEARQDLDALLSWVKQGGHLIAGINSWPEDDNNLIQQWLGSAGISVLDSNTVSSLIEDSDDEFEGYLNTLYLAADPDVELDLFTGYDAYLKPVDPNNNVVVSLPWGGSTLVQRKIGDGLISVYTDYTLFDNYYLLDSDLAYLLTWMLRPSATRVLHYMLHAKDVPDLISTLWLKIPLVIIALTMVLIGYLILSASRLGPIETETNAGQSNLIAHLQARGEFWRRQRTPHAMIEPVRQAAIEKLHQRRGNAPWQQQSAATQEMELITRAAKIAECSVTDARDVLLDPVRADVDLLQSSNVLHKLLYLKHKKPIQRHHE